jgi:hypothetical protein
MEREPWMSDAGFETAQRVEAAASERTAVEAARQFLPDVVLFVSYVVVGVGALVAIIAGCWALSSGIGLVVWHVCTFFGANPASWSIYNFLPDAEPNPSYAAVVWGLPFRLDSFRARGGLRSMAACRFWAHSCGPVSTAKPPLKAVLLGCWQLCSPADLR